MGANVYANGMEVSGKATPHNVVASMPDVCLSPPSPPAGPIPIPYPNFAQASDTTGGSKDVKIGGKEVSLKGRSQYKKSTGDEAATKTLGMGVISHNITGAVKHKAGSFDVKVEGAAVVRNLDLTTGNHMNPGDGCMTVDTAGMAPGVGADPGCEELKVANAQRREQLGQTTKKTTLTHAKIERGGKTTTVWSCSRALGAAYRNGKPGKEGYVSGMRRLKRDTRDRTRRAGGEASNLCPAARKQMRANNGGKTYAASRSDSHPHTSHTEARILESLFAGPEPPPAGTRVTLAIALNKEDDDGDLSIDDNPCTPCRKLICAARECGIEILICDSGNKAKDVESKTGEPCPPSA